MRAGVMARALGFLVTNRFTMWFCAGVCKSQMALIKNEDNIYTYIVRCLDNVAKYSNLRDSNYFYRLCLTGRFARNCCPRFLEEDCFHKLKVRPPLSLLAPSRISASTTPCLLTPSIALLSVCPLQAACFPPLPAILPALLRCLRLPLPCCGPPVCRPRPLAHCVACLAAGGAGGAGAAAHSHRQLCQPAHGPHVHQGEPRLLSAAPLPSPPPDRAGPALWYPSAGPASLC